MTDREKAQVAQALMEGGVYKGAHGLQGLADKQEFWDEQPYSTRLYYGPGIADYLHRSVLESACEQIATLPALRTSHAELMAVVETIVRVADGRAISGNLILDENSPLMGAARDALAAAASLPPQQTA